MTQWSTVALRGPNRWSSQSVLELHADRGLTKKPSFHARAIAECLEAFLDSGRFTTTHPQSVSTARERLRSIRAASDDGALWIAISGWMSAMAGVPSRELTASDRSPPKAASHLHPVGALEMEEEPLSRRCFEMAFALLQAYASGTEYAIADHFRALFDYADDVRLGPSSRAILDAAVQRGISYLRMNRGSLVQLGEGRFQRRIWTAETDATSAIAESIASDKDLTKRLLRNVGIPVPLGRLVTDPEDAWVAAQEVGLPVVVKPRDANHQRGISIELTDRHEILKAYQWAIEDGQTHDVMVEQFARGQHHRLLVVGNRMVAASRGHSETVTGDGKQTISQLVAEVNRDPRRGEAYTHPLSVVDLDAAAHIELAKQGLTIDSIPESGRVVVVSRNGDLTTDCTEVVHPETARQAVLAARVVGLDVAGLDILATDIRLPLAEQHGAVVEVNAGPSLTPHVSPLFGRPQPVGEAIVEMLFPERRTSRIAILGCLVGGSTEAQQEFQQWILACHKQFACVGQVDEGGITVGLQRIPLAQPSVAQRAQAILQHPDVDAMILPIDLRELAWSASPVPRLDRLVVCLAAGDSLDFESSDDAWSALRHTLHPETCIDWCMASDAQRAFIATRLAVS